MRNVMRLVLLFVCAGVLCSSACSGSNPNPGGPSPSGSNIQLPPSAPGFQPVSVPLPGSSTPATVTIIRSDPSPNGMLVAGQTAKVEMDLRGPSGGYGVYLEKRFVKNSSDVYDPCQGTSGGLMYVGPKGDGTMTASMTPDSNTAGVAKLILYFWVDKGDAAMYKVGVSCAETQEILLDWHGPKM